MRLVYVHPKWKYEVEIQNTRAGGTIIKFRRIRTVEFWVRRDNLHMPMKFVSTEIILQIKYEPWIQNSRFTLLFCNRSSLFKWHFAVSINTTRSSETYKLVSKIFLFYTSFPCRHHLWEFYRFWGRWEVADAFYEFFQSYSHFHDTLPLCGSGLHILSDSLRPVELGNCTELTIMNRHL